MKKRILSLFALCLALVCATAVLAGCEPPSKDPKEILGVYVLTQMKVVYADGTRKVHDVDYENNENEMLKELSKLVYKHYNHRYEVEKNSEDYVFRKLRYDAQVEKYVTVYAKPVTVEWESANNCFVLKEGPDGSFAWHYIYSNKGGYYYDGPSFHVNNTYLEVEEFRGFMQENDISSLSIRYGLEK
ncbi:MAG: hypothetical protein K2M89_02580 [Clostridiales bacterium]|nr:hypothetical protein [Clostridiales bacterium]